MIAADENVRERMRAQRERDTGIERAVRSALHAQGFRFRVHQRIVTGCRREADLVFARARVAIFIDGCFWHGCPQHATWPKHNARFWQRKIEETMRRDRDTDQRLAADNWQVIRVWEHEPVEAATARIARAVVNRAG